VAGAQESVGAGEVPSSLAATGGIDATLPIVAVAMLTAGALLLATRRRRDRA
jgi:LPXTG-motif cell wall-anchored protein